MVRSAGIAPASPDWQPGILLLNDDREMAAQVLHRLPAPLYMTKKNEHRSHAR